MKRYILLLSLILFSLGWLQAKAQNTPACSKSEGCFSFNSYKATPLDNGNYEVLFTITNTCNAYVEDINFSFIGLDRSRSQSGGVNPMQTSATGTRSRHYFEFTPAQLASITHTEIDVIAGSRGASVLFDMEECGIKPAGRPVPEAACSIDFEGTYSFGFVDSTSTDGMTTVRFTLTNETPAALNQFLIEVPFGVTDIDVPTNASGEYQQVYNYTVSIEDNLITFNKDMNSGTYANGQSDLFEFSIPTDAFRAEPFFQLSLQTETDFFTTGFNLQTCSDQPITPLPVELSSFTGKATQSNIALTWTTASEENNERFEVERSTDGKRFIKIGEVKGAGNSSVQRKYTFSDIAPEKDVNYYRLKQVDFDGHFEYSKIIETRFKGKATASEMMVYPNPVIDNDIRVALQTSDGAVLQIINQNGKSVYTQQLPAGMREVRLTVSELNIPKGLYYVSLQQPTGKQTQKLLIQ
ncbi:T9SS type A sorting domain-containing protein [Pontibacter oryzae]|uniref:T9SS C-terminal target domain-containing protein n=1 Tax=Pontibacter oryzae TaxID=2304593 RepID=A0A399S375_9BACT|nr:T9SS type A sorting domain-containing protein [Pontibacter oryzae]RIJ36899.1 T9SS C-terminal target domain-containing protein [Pontibacter oryzae]